jgi:hypothetical protein
VIDLADARAQRDAVRQARAAAAGRVVELIRDPRALIGIGLLLVLLVAGRSS